MLMYPYDWQKQLRMFDLFDEFFGNGRLFDRFNKEFYYSSWPYANIYDDGEKSVLTLEIPGVSEKDLEISVVNDTVSIQGERKLNVPEDYATHRKERPEAKFSKTYTMPYKIEAKKVKATLKDGVLTLELPRHPEEKARKIKVLTK